MLTLRGKTPQQLKHVTDVTTKRYLFTPFHPLWDIRLQRDLSIAFIPWQHVNNLPVTGASCLAAPPTFRNTS